MSCGVGHPLEQSGAGGRGSKKTVSRNDAFHTRAGHETGAWRRVFERHSHVGVQSTQWMVILEEFLIRVALSNR